MSKHTTKTKGKVKWSSYPGSSYPGVLQGPLFLKMQKKTFLAESWSLYIRVTNTLCPQWVGG